MDLNDLYQSLSTFWDRISPILFAHLIAFLAIRWIAGTRLNIRSRIQSFLDSDRYKNWKGVFDEFSLRPTLPYILVVGFLVYLTLFNSLLIDSLGFWPISIHYSELEFWEENRPLHQIVEVATFTGNPDIRFWEIAYAKENFTNAFRVRYPDQFASSVSWLLTSYGKWLTYYKCAILFLLFVIVFAVVLYKKRSLPPKAAVRILALIVLAIVAIGFTRYRAEQFIEKQLKAELSFVGTLMHVDPEAQKTKLNEQQVRKLRRNLCLELSQRSSNPMFWWSRELARFLPVSREFPRTSDAEFLKTNCSEFSTTAGGTMRGCPPSQLLSEVGKIASVTNGPVGAAFALLDTGEHAAVDGERHFPMQSVYKLPIAMLVLRQVDAGKLSLDQRIAVKPADFVSDREFSIKRQYPQGAELSLRELLRFMISESDGTACDVLLRLIDGPGSATQRLHELGIENINIARYEKEMAEKPSVSYENWTTAEAAIELLKLLQSGNVISETSRSLLLDLMVNSRPGAKRIKGMLPAGTVVAHKTGTGVTINGVTSATNDVGIITLPDGSPLAIAVFVSDTTADEETREEVIAKIAKVAWHCWVRNSEAK